MPDSRISDLPAATALGAADLAPVVQGSGAAAETRRATFAQITAAMHAERMFHVRDFGAVGDGKKRGCNGNIARVARALGLGL